MDGRGSVAGERIDLDQLARLAENGEFEEVLEALREVTERLENGQVRLRDSMDLHALSRRLVARCEHLLEEAERNFRPERVGPGSKPQEDPVSDEPLPF
jgi:exodeoxyribonuclease VII small subunit